MQKQPLKMAPLGTSSIQATPGPVNQAATQEYFARGSLQSVHIGHWKAIATVLAISLGFCGLGFSYLIPLKTVEIITVGKVEGGGGRIIVEQGRTGWKADQDTIGYFLNSWTEATFDINFSTWKRNVERSAGMVTGVALEQLRELFKREEFNSASIISSKPNFVRTYEFISMNFIKDDVALIRFRLVSRQNAGAPPETKVFALTANFSMTTPKTQQDAIKNPAGIYITSFNLSEEASSK